MIIATLGRLYGKTGLYTIIIIIISSISIKPFGQSYFTNIPTHLNPGSVQFYSILVIFLFLASMRSDKRRYIYYLLFFSGVLLQNYIATISFCIIFLLYGLYSFKINNNKTKISYLFLLISLFPWLQIIIRLLSDISGINNSIKFILFRNSWEDTNNYSIPFTNLINQTPLNNTLSNLYNINEIPNSVSVVFFVFFILLPIFNYILLKKEIKKDIKKIIIVKIITIFFIIDIILNFYASNESQQFNHLAGYSYLFVFLIIFNFLSKLQKNKKQIILFLLIATTTFGNTSNATTYPKDERIITDSVRKQLLNQPIKLANYDFYNEMETSYTDFVYELLYYKVNLCLLRPNKKVELYQNKEEFNALFRNTKFVEHLFCTKKQVEEKNRKSLYLVEDPSMSLPLNFSNATLLTRIRNSKNQLCAPEYYRQLKISNEKRGICTNYYREGQPYNNISVYLEGKLIGDQYRSDDALINQNKIIESSIINGKTQWGGG